MAVTFEDTISVKPTHLSQMRSDRGSPGCYMGIRSDGKAAFIDQAGNGRCTQCYKCHTNGINKVEGCIACGGPARTTEEMEVLKMTNTIKYGHPKTYPTKEQEDMIYGLHDAFED